MTILIDGAIYDNYSDYRDTPAPSQPITYERISKDILYRFNVVVSPTREAIREVLLRVVPAPIQERNDKLGAVHKEVYRQMTNNFWYLSKEKITINENITYYQYVR